MFSKVTVSFLLTVVLLSQPWSASASLLRGSWGNNHEHHIKDARNDSTRFIDCLLVNMDGMAEPDKEITIEMEYVCHVEATETNGAKTLFFNGDVEARFGPEVSSGITKMRIPLEAIHGKVIKSDHPAISINEDINGDHSRRKRQLVQKFGDRKVLLVRIAGNDGYAPEYDKNELYSDFFTDGNNLATRIAACSKNKLTLIPATGTNVDNGVINIRVPMNVKDAPYDDVGDKVTTILSNIENNPNTELEYDARIYIMPNEVEFYSAAAWAEVGGNTIWLKSQYAQSVMVQVHEYGHLLGLHHSGKDNSGYGDPNGYMGNKLSWGDDGTITCFNPAKMWHLGWFEYRHKTIDPSVNAFDGYLVSHDDVVKSNADDLKMIVKVAIGDFSKQFFIMYNRAKGINGGALGDANRVVITEQSGKYALSWHQDGLDEGNREWTFQNFGPDSLTLAVTFCEKVTQGNGRDKARILIYIQGLNDLTCDGQAPPTGSPPPPTGSPPPPTKTCQDTNGWYDSGGSEYNCAWYGGSPSRCQNLGNSYRNMGKVANEACCTCGGGTQTNHNRNGPPAPRPSPVNRPAPTRSPVAAPASTPKNGCQDVNGWYDSGGSKYNCAWYAKYSSRCQWLGNSGRNMGKVANEACCTCGGGI